MIFSLVFISLLALRAHSYCQAVDLCTSVTCSSPLAYPANNYDEGIPNGKETSLPLIDTEFIQTIEGLCLCGYIPMDNKCRVINNRGLTVGMGVDVSLVNNISLFPVPGNLAHLLSLPKGNALKGRCERNPTDCEVTLTEDEAKNYSKDFINAQVTLLEQRFNHEAMDDGSRTRFRDLNRATRTVLASLYHRYGNFETIDDIAEEAWSNNWRGLIEELKDFDPPGDSEYPGRFSKEIMALRYAYGIFPLTSDKHKVLFLIDASQSVTAEDLVFELSYAKDLADTWDVNANKMAVALITYGSSASVISNFKTNKTDFITSVNSAKSIGGEANFKNAISESIDLFDKAQFSENDPKVIILVTASSFAADKEVQDLVSKLKEKSVNCFAVGVGKNVGNIDSFATIASQSTAVSTFNDLLGLVDTMKDSVTGTFSKIPMDEPTSLNLTTGTYPFSKEYDSITGMTIEIEGSNLNIIRLYASRVGDPNVNTDRSLGVNVDGKLVFSILPDGYNNGYDDDDDYYDDDWDDWYDWHDDDDDDYDDDHDRLLQSMKEKRVYFNIKSRINTNITLTIKSKALYTFKCPDDCRLCAVENGACYIEEGKDGLSSKTIWIIVGSVLGGVVVIVCVSVLVYCLCRKKKTQPAVEETDNRAEKGKDVENDCEKGCVKIEYETPNSPGDEPIGMPIYTPENSPGENNQVNIDDLTRAAQGSENTSSAKNN